MPSLAGKVRDMTQLQQQLARLQQDHDDLQVSADQRVQHLQDEVSRWRDAALHVEGAAGASEVNGRCTDANASPLDDAFTSYEGVSAAGEISHRQKHAFSFRLRSCEARSACADDQVLFDDDLLSYVSDTDYADMQADCLEVSRCLLRASGQAILHLRQVQIVGFVWPSANVTGGWPSGQGARAGVGG